MRTTGVSAALVAAGALALAAGAAVPARALTAQEIAARASAAYAADKGGITDYQCRFASVRLNGEGEEEQRYSGYNYFREPDRFGQEITEMYVKGKKKDPNEGGGESESVGFKLPFDAECIADYTFAYSRTDVVDGVECYVLTVASDKREEGYVHGRAWVESAGFKVLALDVAMYKNPKYVTEMGVKVWFADFGGHRMLRKFVAVGKFSAFLVMRGSFTITETYDDYRFDVGVPDAKLK